MKNYHVWAVQFHPEKNAFEHHWKIFRVGEDILARSRLAIEAMMDIATDFIHAARSRPWGGWDAAEMAKWSVDNYMQYPSKQFTFRDDSIYHGKMPKFDSIYIVASMKPQDKIAANE